MQRTPFRLFANEARRCIRIAGARVASLLRIGTGGTLHDDGLRGVVTLVFGGDQLFWRGSGLDPLGERREDVMLRVYHGCRQPLSTAEPIRSFAAANAAMLDAGQKEETCGALQLVLTSGRLGERLVEGDRCERIDD